MSSANRANMGIGFRPRFGGTMAKELAFGVQLRVYFKTYDDIVLHSLFIYLVILVLGRKLILAHTL